MQVSVEHTAWLKYIVSNAYLNNMFFEVDKPNQNDWGTPYKRTGDIGFYKSRFNIKSVSFEDFKNNHNENSEHSLKYWINRINN